MSGATRAFFALRYARAYPRFAFALAMALAAWLLAPAALPSATRLLVAWNAGAFALIAALLWLMRDADEATIRRRAARQDVNPFVIVLVVVVATFASLGAIVAQLGASKGLEGWDKAAHVGLVVATIVSGWAATHLVFTLHYAHEYFGDGEDGARGGLDFPGEQTPDYSDFVYFAFVIAVASQTADVAIVSRAMRRLAVTQGVFAFFYNLAVLGLTVNISASLI
ncbi:MAG: DUF1345 domain-containing protein [Methylobacteriaceae bacterium]|nr:DUF1345 domain-containing protein [Methylobacteriaceae bacterium]